MNRTYGIAAICVAVIAMFIGIYLYTSTFPQSLTPRQVVSQIENGTVFITIPDKTKGNYSGSGFFIDNNLILTNFHVINHDGPIYVLAKDNPKVYTATVSVGDELSDLAILKLDDWKSFYAENKYHIFKFSSNKNVDEGDKVYVSGNPELFTWTVTQGIVAGVNQHIPDSVVEDIFPYTQVDARLLHGNSGGPITNDQGDVIAISDKLIPATGGFPNDFNQPDAAGGIGLGIPVDIVKKVVTDFLNGGGVNWTLLGIGADHSNLTDLHYTVTKVAPGSVADKAGIKSGDTLLTVVTKNTPDDGVNVSDFTALRDQMYSLNVGDDVAITVMRNGKPLTFNMKMTTTKTSKEYLAAIIPAKITDGHRPPGMMH